MSGPEFSFRTWTKKAENDLLVMRRTLSEAPVPWDNYSAQQASEKYLRAFLPFRRQEPPKSHDLVLLLQLCVEHDPRLAGLQGDCALLTPYLLARYPSQTEPDEGDARAAIAAAQRVRSEILKRLPE